MRFFKYLVFIFLSIISLRTFAADVNSYVMDGINGVFESPQAVCKAKLDKYKSERSDAANWSINASALPARCQINGGGWWAFDAAIRTVVTSCPVVNYPMVLWFKSAPDVTPTSVPVRRCVNGCTYTGNGRAIETSNGHWSTILTATGGNANCSDANTDTPPPKCDTKDPYGSCYVPPNDNCFRASDGSIYCPDNQQPPRQQGCENGATYCKRPPDGCGSDYVPGSFNGEQLCVKKGPDSPKDPDEPDNPPDDNQCKNGEAYCNKPKDKQCPAGYYQSFYNGAAICVKDNPNPEQPNQNDPNNNPNAGDGDGNGDGNGDGDGDGENEGGASHAAGSCNGTNNCNVTNNKIDVKSILNAIATLRDALLQALSSIKDTLVDGFKKLTESQDKTNEKLDKTNEHLEKSNEHLEKIEESTGAASETLGDIKDLLGDNAQAASEAAAQTNEKLDAIKESTGAASEVLGDIKDLLGDNAQAASEAAAQTNEKLDGIKDAIEGQYGCPNENYNRDNPESSKYRKCTEDDLNQGLGEEVTTPFKDFDIGVLNTNLYRITGQCPAPIQMYVPVVQHTYSIDLSRFCDVLAVIGMFISIAACIHGISILVEST